MAPEQSLCPCGSGTPLATCCGPYLYGEISPATAEALMRSRYSAYALGRIAYLRDTLDPKKSDQFDEAMVRELSENAVWQGLEILEVVRGQEGDTYGEVEFVARFTLGGDLKELKERSTFKRVRGQWTYSAGKVRLGEPEVRRTPKVGRNDPCPCGSGRKSKKCCGRG